MRNSNEQKYSPSSKKICIQIVYTNLIFWKLNFYALVKKKLIRKKFKNKMHLKIGIAKK